MIVGMTHIDPREHHCRIDFDLVRIALVDADLAGELALSAMPLDLVERFRLRPVVTHPVQDFHTLAEPPHGIRDESETDRTVRLWLARLMQPRFEDEIVLPWIIRTVWGAYAGYLNDGDSDVVLLIGCRDDPDDEAQPRDWLLLRNTDAKKVHGWTARIATLNGRPKA